MGRVGATAALELRATLANPLLWGLVLLATLATLTVNPAAMIPSGNAEVGGIRPFSNSRYALAQVFALSGLLFYALLPAMIAGNALLRDDDARIGDLLHSTPLSAGEYVAGKVAGVLGGLGAVVAFQVALAMAWNELGGLIGADTWPGPFRVGHYLEPALVFLLPGLLCCVALAFAAAEWTRTALPVHAAGVGVFAITLTGLIPGTERLAPGLDRAFALLDVWGARWLSHTVFDADRGIDFYNQAPLAWDADFLLNRAFVLGVALAALFATWRHRSSAARGRKAVRAWAWPWRGRDALSPAPVFSAIGAATGAKVSASPGTMRGVPTSLPRGAWTVARAELAQAARTPALYLLALFAVLLTWELAGSARGVFEAPVLLTSGGLAVSLVEVVTGVGCLLLLFYIVESLDRLRSLRVDALVFATPLPTAALLLGVHLAGAVLVGVLLAACGSACLLAIALQGVFPLAPGPFALVWGALLAPTFALWAAGVTATFALVRGRYATYAVALLALTATVASAIGGSTTWLTNWPLWGALRWTDFDAIALDGQALAMNRLLFAALAGLLATVAVATFNRREPDRVARRPWPIAARRLALFCTLLALLPALWLVAAIHDGFQGGASRDRAKDYWRRNVETWASAPAPALRHVDARIELEPAERRMRVTGTYLVANDADDPTRRLAFTIGPSFEKVAWQVNAIPIDAEDRSGLHILDLASALAPGATLEVGFTYEAVVPRGISRNGGGASSFILPAGVVLDTLGPDFLPVPGFVDGIGVDEANRTLPRELPADFWRAELPPIVGHRSAFTSRLEIELPSAYGVTSVGDLVEERVDGGRRTAVWRSEHPVRFLNLVAARWNVAREGDVAVFHHPGHGANVQEMLATLVAARRHFSDWFHPYPWRTLTLSEYPDLVARAQSFPTNIPFSEGMGFLVRGGDRSYAPAIVTAHEAAHQWWGHLLLPGRGPGADVLIEGMAHYATLRLLEAEHGLGARIDFATTLEARYAERRRVDAERPLTEIFDGRRPEDETAIYDKGAWVLWMLERHLGRERMQAGLRTFIQRYRENRDHPALHDFIETLRPFATDGDAYQAFVDAWLFAVVLPELQIVRATLERAGDDWAIAAEVRNVGTAAALIELAALAAPYAPDDPGPQARVTLELPPGQSRAVTWQTSFQPDRVVVDPDALVLQLNRDRAFSMLEPPKR